MRKISVLSIMIAPILCIVLSVSEGKADRIPIGLDNIPRAGVTGDDQLAVELALSLVCDMDQWRERTVLCFSGRPRFSGLSNWDALRRYLDGDRGVEEGLQSICRAARGMEGALRAVDVERAATALDQDWQARKKISEKVCTSEVESLIEVARGSGALAGKVCGAGGGGCLVFLVAPGKRQEVEEALEALGARILPFSFCGQGVEIEEHTDIRG